MFEELAEAEAEAAYSHPDPSATPNFAWDLRSSVFVLDEEACFVV